MTWDRRGRGRPFSYSTGSHPGGRRPLVHDGPRAAPPRRVGPLAARLRRAGRRLRRGPGRHARGGLPPHLRHPATRSTGSRCGTTRAAAATPLTAREGPVGTHWGPTPPPSVRSPTEAGPVACRPLLDPSASDPPCSSGVSRSGGPRNRTWRCGFGDRRVTDTPVPLASGHCTNGRGRRRVTPRGGGRAPGDPRRGGAGRAPGRRGRAAARRGRGCRAVRWRRCGAPAP